MSKYLSFFTITIVIILMITSCDTNKNSQKKLIIFHAGSLSVPFKQMIDAFKQDYPDAIIYSEVAGSRACARKITDLNKDCDIMASADYTVIDQLLIPHHTSWNIRFASNEMSIAFTSKSKYADQINEMNWYKYFLQNDVIFGRSDPNSDPCGYRSVLTSKLAENFYKSPGLADKLLSKDQKYIRPKETDLLALLESNILDYVFIYRSVAEQHNLNYIVLPDEINLKKKELQEHYNSVTVDISGKKPGEYITKTGEPMIYGITILEKAPNKELALKFVDFVLSDKGQEIMIKNGQASLVPSFTPDFDHIPGSLKKYATE